MNYLKKRINGDFEGWKKRRYHMLILMALQQFMNGVEYSITYATMWLYIKSINGSHANENTNRTFYAAIATSKFISTILLSPMIGKIMDRYRCLTTLTLVANVLALIGNLVYTFNWSIWWLLIGAFLTGIQGTTRPIGYSEVARCYPKQEVQSKLALTAGADGVGFLVGPLFNFFFVNFDVKIGKWHLNYFNAAVGFLSIIYLILIISDLLFLSDISKERDYTEEEDGISPFTDDECGFSEKEFLLTKQQQKQQQQQQQQTVPVKWTAGNYIDAFLIFLMTFLSAFLPYMEDIWASLLMIDVQGLTVKEMNIFFLVCAISSISTMFIFMKYKFSQKTLYFLAVTWLICLLIQQNTTAILKLYHTSYWLTMFMWTVVGIATTQIVSLEYYFLVDLLPKMVTSCRLSYWSSMRWSLYMTGCLLASLVGPYLFTYLEYEVLIVNGLTMIVLLGIVIRRQTFINPAIIV